MKFAIFTSLIFSALLAGSPLAFSQGASFFDQGLRHFVTMRTVDRAGGVKRTSLPFVWVWSKEDPTPCAQVKFEENGHPTSVCVREASSVFPLPAPKGSPPVKFHYIIDLPFKGPVVVAGPGCEKLILESTLMGDFFITAVQCNSMDIRAYTSPSKKIRITRLRDSTADRNHFKFVNQKAVLLGEIVLQTPRATSIPALPVAVAKPTPSVLEKKRIFSTVGLGVTSISYRELGVDPYSSFALTAKGSLNYPIVPGKWDLGFSTYLTALQLSKTPDVAVRFFGLNARIGYILPKVVEPWRVSISGGLYYLTMSVAGNAFGFRNLGGPQIYPAVRRTLKNGDALSMYAKYSPVASNFSLVSLSNREMATGLAFTHPLKNGRSVSATLDYSNVELVINEISISNSTFTFGVGYGF